MGDFSACLRWKEEERVCASSSLAAPPPASAPITDETRPEQLEEGRFKEEESSAALFSRSPPADLGCCGVQPGAAVNY